MSKMALWPPLKAILAPLPKVAAQESSYGGGTKILVPPPSSTTENKMKKEKLIVKKMSDVQLRQLVRRNEHHSVDSPENIEFRERHPELQALYKEMTLCHDRCMDAYKRQDTNSQYWMAAKKAEAAYFDLYLHLLNSGEGEEDEEAVHVEDHRSPLQRMNAINQLMAMHRTGMTRTADMRARLVVEMAETMTSRQIAQVLSMTPQLVDKLRNRRVSF